MANDIIPKESTSRAEPVDADTDSYLRAAAIVEAINANTKTPLAPIPKEYVFKARDRGDVSAALHAAFELCGGVPNLVAFAKSYPKEFFTIWSRLLPSEQQGLTGGTTLIFNSAVPANPLDDVTIDATGRVTASPSKVTTFIDEDIPE